MIEIFKLLHDKYYGEYSQLVKLHASHISREGTPLQVVSGGFKVELKKTIRLSKDYQSME